MNIFIVALIFIMGSPTTEPNAPGTMIPICHRDSRDDPTFEEIEIRADELEFHVASHGDRYPVPRFGCDILNVTTSTTSTTTTTTTTQETTTTSAMTVPDASTTTNTTLLSESMVSSDVHKYTPISISG